MRHFQPLLLAVLAVISVELGLVIAQRPTPIAQAGPSTTTAPTPGLLDPHDVLRAQLDRIEKELAEVRRELATSRQELAAIRQDHGTLLKYGHTWFWTCVWAGNLFGDLDSARVGRPHIPNSDVRVLPREECYVQLPSK